MNRPVLVAVGLFAIVIGLVCVGVDYSQRGIASAEVARIRGLKQSIGPNFISSFNDERRRDDFRLTWVGGALLASGAGIGLMGLLNGPLQPSARASA